MQALAVLSLALQKITGPGELKSLLPFHLKALLSFDTLLLTHKHATDIPIVLCAVPGAVNAVNAAVMAAKEAGRGMMELPLQYNNITVGTFILLRADSYFTGEEVALLEVVVSMIAVTLFHLKMQEEISAREAEKALLLTISNDLSAVRDRDGLLRVVHERLEKVFHFTHVVTLMLDLPHQLYRVNIYDPRSKSRQHPDYTRVTTAAYSITDALMSYCLSLQAPAVMDLDDWMQKPGIPALLTMNHASGIKEIIAARLETGGETIGVLGILSDQHHGISAHHLSLVGCICSQLANAVANIQANEAVAAQLQTIAAFRQQLEEENSYLQEEIQTSNNYSEIIGPGMAMRNVLELVSQVAVSQSSVLILGETGTGKELIARALHNASPRSHKLMVKINCASLPPNLIESELFGHEKGSFTGALERRIGKFELANDSTLFLDEVGELPLDLQAKLLRALQEKEIERVGGQTVIRTNVRVIAATNRDLEKEVLAGNFRSDLFYRLNVFPVVLPPLRERREDIPILAAHFVQKHAKKLDRKLRSFSAKAMKQLTAYSWPGNVRELEHIIERSMLMAKGNVISQVPLPEMDAAALQAALPDAYIKTIDEVEREHIITVLRKTNGKVAGIGGAAALLRIPSTTLNSKIRRLQIKKGFINQPK